MYTTSDLVEICSLYYTQSAMQFYWIDNQENKCWTAMMHNPAISQNHYLKSILQNSTRRTGKQRAASLRCMLWKIAADMIYKGEY